MSKPVRPQEKSPDLIIFNAKIRTLDYSLPAADALAVTGNRISHVGGNTEIRRLASAATRIIDARKKLMIPGFNDAHVHFLNMGTQFFSMSLRGIKSEAALIEKIRYYTEFLPENSWILGSGWDTQNLYLTATGKAEIDRLTGANPLFIYGLDIQSALINAKTFEIVSQNKSTAELKTLGFELNAAGRSSGTVHGRAVGLVKSYAPPDALADRAAVAEAATNYAARFGVTSVQDMQVDNNLNIYRRLQRSGKLKTRVYDCVSLLDQAKYIQTKISREPSAEMARGGCFKFFVEGAEDDLARLYENILSADRAGWQIMIHAIGERANRLALDAFGRVSEANGPRDRRFRIEHAHNFSISDIGRFKKFGVIPSMQPQLFFGGTFNQSEPYRSLLEAGVYPAFGSDSFMIEVNPLWGIYAAVVKSNAAGEISDQSLTVAEAVRAYTLGAAYAEFQENIKGTISKGKLADFVILSDDIFTIEPEQIRNTKVLMTVVDGQIVYQAK